MNRKAVSGIMLIPILVSILSLTYNINPGSAEGPIRILADGSIDPPTANIATVDKVVYTFTADIYDAIEVERNNIVLDGAGFTLQKTRGLSNSGIFLQNRNNVTIKNIEIREWTWPILFINSSNNIISGNTITNNSFAIHLIDSSINIISENNIRARERSNAVLILMESSSNNSIYGNDIVNNDFNGLRIDPLSHNNTIIGNNITVRMMAVGISGSSNIVSRNNITYDGEYGIFIGGSSNVISRNNIIGLGGGIYLSNIASDNIISRNIVVNNWDIMRGSGIRLGNSHNNTISGNTLVKFQYGIHANASSNNIIYENNVMTTSAGLYIEESVNNTIYRNDIVDNYCGIRLIKSPYNSIYENNIAGNQDGIILAVSSNNTIYHNNFKNNIKQVNDIGPTNYGGITSIIVWDDGYPSGGNYWSDYTGFDLHSGPYQNKTGSDGIGDTPYVINAANIDRYPFFPSLTIITNFLPRNIFGQFSSHSFFAEGGVPPYLWSLVNGTLPPGMDFSSDGILEGIPTAAGNFTFTVRVTDSNNKNNEKTFTNQIVLTLPPVHLRIKKFGTKPSLGRSVYYYILVENVGNVIAQDFELIEILEPWFFFLSSYPEPENLSNVTYNIVNAETNEMIGNLTINNIILWKIPILPPSESVIISYEAELHPSVPVGFEVGGGKFCRDREGEPCWEKFKSNVKLLAGTCTSMCTITTALGALEASQAKTVNDLWKKVGSEIFSQQMPSACIECINSVGTIAENRLEVCKYETYTFTSPDAPYCDEKREKTIRPLDPNEKVVIAEKFIKPNETLVYSIHFENIGNVSARDIFVYDTIEDDLNTSTVEVLYPGEGFIPLPEDETVTLLEREKYETITIDNTTINIPINEKWTVTLQGSTIFWNLTGVDLPPNATGEVILSVKPLRGLPSGTEIRNNATIQFEIFETITTNNTINIIDDIPPNSVFNALPDETSTLNFTISWKGTDPVGKIDFYSVFVSVDGGGFTEFKRSREQNLSFPGEPDTDYGFIIIAADTAGNVEVKPPIAEAVTHTPRTLIQTSTSIQTSKSEVTQGDSITIAGSINPVVSGAEVSISFKKPNGSIFTRTVTTDSDGSYSDMYEPTETGSWNIVASWEGDAEHEGSASQQIAFTVEEKVVPKEEEKKGCIIATATYGSELAPEIQFLRGFRDNTVLNTFAGRGFMTIFNTWYYSFSPEVASIIAANNALRGIMKILLYPLIGILHLAEIAFSLFSFNHEFSIVVSGLVASSLIGVIYIAPFALIIRVIKKVKVHHSTLRAGSMIWIVSIGGILAAEITRWSSIMMFSTAVFVVITMILATLSSVKYVARYIQH